MVIASSDLLHLHFSLSHSHFIPYNAIPFHCRPIVYCIANLFVLPTLNIFLFYCILVLVVVVAVVVVGRGGGGEEGGGVGGAGVGLESRGGGDTGGGSAGGGRAQVAEVLVVVS